VRRQTDWWLAYERFRQSWGDLRNRSAILNGAHRGLELDRRIEKMNLSIQHQSRFPKSRFLWLPRLWFPPLME
jgi:hypothetical protein